MGYLKAIICMFKGHRPIKCFEDTDHEVMQVDEFTENRIKEMIKYKKPRLWIPSVCCARCKLLIEPEGKDLY